MHKNMNTPFENFIRSVKAQTLSDASSARLRSALASYADLHTVPDGVSFASAASPFMKYLRSRHAVYAFLLIIVVLGGGSGATLAAEKSLPGDVLYPVKTELNEKITARFATTPEERARHSARLAERRVDEAVALADEGKLDAKTALYLDQEVTAHIESSDSAADTLESNGDLATALAVRTDLEENLSQRADALHTLALAARAPEGDAEDTHESDDTNTTRIALAESIDAKVRTIHEARLHTETAVLPGIAASEGTFNLALLRGDRDAKPEAEDGNPEATVTVMSTMMAAKILTKEEATTTATTSDEEEVHTETRKAFFAPSGEVNATQSLWFKATR